MQFLKFIGWLFVPFGCCVGAIIGAVTAIKHFIEDVKFFRKTSDKSAWRIVAPTAELLFALLCIGIAIACIIPMYKSWPNLWK